MNKEAPLNVRNIKTKPSDDEWSTPYDTALPKKKKKKNDETSAVCRGFS